MSHRITTPRRSIGSMVRQHWVNGQPILWWTCPECHYLSPIYKILYCCMRDVEEHLTGPCG